MGSIVEIDNHLLDKDACETLPGSRICRWRIPCRWQVMRQFHQACAIDLRARSSICLQTTEALFQLGDALQSHIPTGFQFPSDQTLCRIDHLVSPSG
jgi:hypothetical protein